ncbi:DUF4352 domain-containing protein [Oceanobacillus neutriphilus]|uniref:DUF4352 domain-containing protein n=1 Tax=Oceanobacillus neutriphilus TaxID=531815 RepID=A0ABQ2NQ47_9BACI|nr:DUF4352 domain-containing protein [Oceanobacillus neutriphilus]GGP07919.1 hypothetical protein GCM10011346_06090 [Oceanobacillus neutriphilus]
MKKLLFLLVGMMLFLAACGDDNNDSSAETSTEDEGTTEASEESNNEEDSGESEEPATEEDEENTEPQVGDVVTNEGGESTLVSKIDEIGTFESGPIELTINKVNGVSMSVSEDYVDTFGTDQLEYIQVDMEVENTSDDNVDFYASQAILTTSTGEQLEPDFLMSDHIDGEFFGNVNKSGSSYYVLENSKAEDVESVRLIFSGTNDENYETIGEDIDVEIDLNK